MTLCPHGHGELDASGNCPKQNLHVKARVGVACPLCGGPAHKRETDATTQQLQCAWRQYTRSIGLTGMAPLDATRATDFAHWLTTRKPSYGREAQYQALAASGTPLSPAMAKDAARYTPGAAPTTVAPTAPEAPHTAAQEQPEPSYGICPHCGNPRQRLSGVVCCPTCMEQIDAAQRATPEPATPAAEAPDDRRARLRQALAS